MLFVFDDASLHQFWMKGVFFPLDFVWIRDNKVIGLTFGAQPESGPQYTIYSPPEPANLVLEVSAGSVQQSGIRIGDTVISNNSN